MSFPIWPLVAAVVYLLGFMALTVGISIWLKKRRKDRVPIAVKLLRGPGESIRRRIAAFDENFVAYMSGAAFAPGIPAFALLFALVYSHPTSPSVIYVSVALVALVFLVVFIFAVRWMLGYLNRHRDDRLGYLGEREVAEHLEPLLAKGYRVFHDAPAEGFAKDFNLDHVTIGPTGVTVIETKTRRKGRARPGFKDHIVTYDGAQLIWPWGEDRHGLEQAKNEADWLRKFIHTRTGLDVEVKAILALPGWFVEMKARGEVVVANSKTVAHAVEGKGRAVLTDEQIDLIARQLDQLCRDVEL